MTVQAPAPEVPTILTTPPVTPPSPESQLFPNTPTGTPPATPTPPAVPPAPPAAPQAGEPPATPPVTPPAAPSEPPKAPTEPPKPVVPQTPAAPPKDYVLSLPEGSPLTQDQLAQIAKSAKESGLSEDKAKEMVTQFDKTARDAVSHQQEQQQSAFKAAQAQWPDQLQKDPVYGGDNYKETVALASRFFQESAPPEIQKWIADAGLASFPPLVKWMAKLGKATGEDRLVLGRVGDVQGARDAASVLYGKTTPGADGKKPT